MSANLLLNSTVLGAIATVVGKYFQHNAARLKAAAERQTRETDEATRHYESVSAGLDQRLYATLRAYRALAPDSAMPKKELTSQWQKYQDALVEWHHRSSLALAGVRLMFGAMPCRKRLDEIVEGFEFIDSELEAVYFGRKTHGGLDTAFSELTLLIRQLSEAMLIQIHAGQVGANAPGGVDATKAVTRRSRAHP